MAKKRQMYELMKLNSKKEDIVLSFFQNNIKEVKKNEIKNKDEKKIFKNEDVFKEFQNFKEKIDVLITKKNLGKRNTIIKDFSYKFSYLKFFENFNITPEDCVNISSDIENTLFNDLSDEKYKEQVFKIYLSIHDHKNNEFKKKIFQKSIDLKKISKMKIDEMYSENNKDQKNLLLKKKEDILFYLPVQIQNQGNVFCKSCGSNQCIREETITRSKDEATTLIIKCLSCGSCFIE